MSDRENRPDAWLERVKKEYAATPPPGAEAKKRIDEALRFETPPGSRRRPLPRFGARFWALAAAVTLLLGVAAWKAVDSRRSERNNESAQVALAAPEPTAVVRFALSAPAASSVSLVGDFNGWDTTAAPMHKSNSGVWTVSVPVSHGRHVYAFVVNESRWVNDPEAPLSPEDGFGVTSSVLVVGGGI